MLRQLNLLHWCVLGLIGIVLVFAVVLPFAARAAVGLIDMTATAQADGTILVEWETATELDTTAFQLYRAQTSNGPWNPIGEPILAEGTGSTGATYEFIDSDVEAGTYYYLLEEIETNGTRTKLVDFIVWATVPSTVTITPTPTRTRTPTPTSTPRADRIIYLPLLLRAN